LAKQVPIDMKIIHKKCSKQTYWANADVSRI
jgi:hypothetical protein